jgi:hypothetical protein
MSGSRGQSVFRRGFCVLLLLLAASVSGQGQDVVHRKQSELVFSKDSILLFAGALSTGNMEQSLVPFSHPDGNFIIGGAYSRDLFEAWTFVFSAEVGLAGRFGDGSSGEIWGAGGLRYRIPISDVARLSLGLFVGLSVVTDPIGIERVREARHDGDATLLFYFTPELALQLASWPNTELVYRLHHRSGLFRTLGNMVEGTNAHVLGVRWRR